MALTEESTFYILALCDYDPVHGGGSKVEESINEAPSSAFQLSFTCGQTFEVVGSDIINWWLYVKGVSGQDEGYIPSVCFAPLRKDISAEEIQELVEGGTLLMSHINTDVDLRFFPDAPNPKLMGTERCPEETANILSKITFWWLNSLIMKGYRKPLETQDLWLLSEHNKSSKIVPKLQQEWKKEQSKSKKSKKYKVQTDTETAHLNMETEEVAVTFPSSSEKNRYRPSLVKALVRVFLPFFSISILLKLVSDMLIFVQPQLLKVLIEHAEDKSSPDWKGYVYVLAMVLVAIIQYTFSQHSIHVMFVAGMRVGIAILGIVYSKALQLCNSSRNCSTAGEILNLMSVDSQRLVQLVYSLNQVWSTPLQVCIAIYFLYITMGASTLAGVAVLLLLIPINILVTRFQRRLQVKQLQYKDARVKLISEALSGVKVLKLYAWEESFIEKILEVRRQEIQYQKHSMYLTCTLFFFNSSAPMLVSLATFCVYTLSGNELTATKAFVAISLFNILRFPLSVFSRVVGNIIQAQVSLARLNDFLNLEEKDPENVLHVMPEHVHAQAVHVENGTFSWEQNGQPVLENINLNITSGSLVAVVGQVGCGKSSLLSALLGETEKLDGMVYVKGTTAYVPQQAWIQNATVQENVLFGKMMDTRRYKEVIRACALQPDLKVLPAGDLTEIGEKGINLSGGQKQRVSLARAVYFNADVYLLDDPLSAVDSHVGKHIFDKVLGPTGLIQDKTRILVTHRLQYLQHCDQIVVLQNGKISEIGTYNELVANQGAFAEFLNTYKNGNGNGNGKGFAGTAGKHEADSNVGKTPRSSQAKAGANTLKLPGFKEVELSARKVTSFHHLNMSGSHHDIGQTRGSRAKSETNLATNLTHRDPLLTRRRETRSPQHHSKASVPRMVLSMEGLVSCPCEADFASNVCDLGELESSEDDVVVSADAKKVEVKEDEEEEEEGEEADDKSKLTRISPRMRDEKKGLGRTTTVERAQTGRVKCSDVQAYSKAFGLVLFLVCLFLIFISEAFIVSSRIWLADWSTANITTTNTRDMYIGVYGGLGLSQAVALLLGGFLLSNGATRASRGLHNHLLLNVLRSPMSFFETTPLGRIVNRFSKDTYMIDDGIPRTLMMFFRMCLGVVGTIFVISYSTPLFLACVVPLLGLYIFVQRVYIGSSRQLRRIESVTRSPVYGHFFETITGTNVIRAYAQQKRFLLDHHYKVDATHMANYPYICSNRWLGLRLEFIGALILLFAALFAVLYRDSLPAGLVGLSVAIALQITGVLTWLVRMSSELETNIVAVERVKEYSQTPTEAPWIIPGYRPPLEWPQEGNIDVDGLGLRYRNGQPFVLHNVSCQIDGGEKVGIVGRTGAGKSTLSMALFRILECNMGKIIIDNIDISKIGLHDLRTRITIIPQDPILFSGTIRMNLDPFNHHDDEELWRVLEVVHLKSYVSGLQDGLQYTVQEGGDNLSVGQCQLVCLARALLRKSKILVLDEATAAIDMETDELIQQTIRTEFADQTVLTIAHRLNTIMDYDRIMVLEHGSVVEFDTPAALLTRKKVFYDMAKDAGLTL
ncbi:multidrug resistance-associated protein 1-like [Actinia tenebrosa]|uniref:ABC-type glutathione-S-conjugate transporter n=1 Tax=Actinia tenebrosa TaxID=6105 RepID=A0A6P8INL7_ACTTE|nr:multidrug resistance-associated protein 1-like [Actinia tenebrosa]